MKIQDLLTDESKWTKGTYARDATGAAVDDQDPAAVAWCLTGAAFKCYGFNPTSCRLIREMAVETACAALPYWNDEHATFPEVRALIERLDI